MEFCRRSVCLVVSHTALNEVCYPLHLPAPRRQRRRLLLFAQASVFVYLGDQMRLIVAGQMPNVTSDRQLFFQDVSLLLQALLGLAVGEEQVLLCLLRESSSCVCGPCRRRNDCCHAILMWKTAIEAFSCFLKRYSGVKACLSWKDT